MHKIDGPGHVGGQFVREDAATGRAPTLVTPEWLNAVQGELATLVTAAGLALDKANSAQVLEALKMIFGDGPGSVSFFARPTAPVGFLKANGAAISRTAYAALFASVGTTFGAGDGVSTFNLPDLRGEFLRGFDDGRGVDVGRVLGTFQVGSDLSGQLYGNNNAGSGNGWRSDQDHSTTGWDQPGSLTMTSHVWTRLADDSTIGGATAVVRAVGKARPRNVALLACIKY